MMEENRQYPLPKESLPDPAYEWLVDSLNYIHSGDISTGAFIQPGATKLPRFTIGENGIRNLLET